MVGDSVALSNTFRSERTQWAPSQRAPGASGKHSAPPRAEVRLRGRGVRCARVLRELTPWLVFPSLQVESRDSSREREKERRAPRGSPEPVRSKGQMTAWTSRDPQSFSSMGASF